MARPVPHSFDVTQTRWWRTGHVDWELIRSLSDDDLYRAYRTSMSDEPGAANFWCGLHVLPEFWRRGIDPNVGGDVG